ncbi:MAG: hypothetical protein ABH884_03745 [Candidatus Komeilibacteria bacterium]
MNLLGHNYIAYKVLGSISPYTLIGSHIPDFVPFLPSSVFKFEEIHENQEDFLNFVRKNYPEANFLPLSMMCHSVKYGADKYNREIDTWLLEGRDDLADEISRMITESSGVSFETARGPRLHNYLWCGADLYLINNNPDGLTDKLVSSLENIDYDYVSEIFAKFYGKDKKLIRQNLLDHFKFITSETFKDVSAFVKFWSKFLSPLREGDNLDTEKGAELLKFIYREFEDDWEKIIGRVEGKVKVNMKPFL